MPFFCFLILHLPTYIQLITYIIHHIPHLLVYKKLRKKRKRNPKLPAGGKSDGLSARGERRQPECGEGGAGVSSGAQRLRKVHTATVHQRINPPVLRGRAKRLLPPEWAGHRRNTYRRDRRVGRLGLSGSSQPVFHREQLQ